VALAVQAEGLTVTVTEVNGSGAGRRVTYGPLTGDLVVKPGAEVTVDGKPVAPTHDTGSGGQKPPEDVIVVQSPPPPPAALSATVRGGAVKLSRTGVATIASQLRGGSATGTLTLTAKLGRRTVRIGNARVALTDGRTVKTRIKVTKPARRAARRGLRATASLSVPGAAAARAAVRLRR
jgi:hypothetical protein